MKRGLLVIFCFVVVSSSLSAVDVSTLQEGKTGEGKQTVHYRWAEVGQGDRPALLLFLHGRGERGSNNRSQLRHGVPSLLKWLEKEKKHCVVVVPQCPGDVHWSNKEGSHKDPKLLRLKAQPSYPMVLVFKLLDDLVRQKNVDKSRIYITGLSMGGYGTFDALARRPQFFAAAIPVCGGGDLRTVPKIKHVPMWVFHGDADRVVPARMSSTMVKAINAAGGSAKYTEYPGVGHDSWSATYANPKVWEWLFAQKK